MKIRSLFISILLLTSLSSSSLSGELNSRFYTASNVLVTTDMEPDDVVSIYMMMNAWHKSGQQPKSITFLVGERENDLKVFMTHAFLDSLPFTLPSNITVLRGKSSKKNHYVKALLPLLSEADQHLSRSPAQLTELEEILTDVRPELIISLKPDRELLTEEFATMDLSYAQYWHYGSFNDRTLKKDWGSTSEFSKSLKQHYTRFGEVILLESFHAFGDSNTLDNETGEMFYANLVESNTPFTAYLSAVIYNWNEGLLVEIANEIGQSVNNLKVAAKESNTALGISTAESMQRNIKIYANIMRHPKAQMVIADQLVATLLISNHNDPIKEGLQRLSLDYNLHGYTNYTPDQDSSLWGLLLTPEQQQKLRDKVLDTLNKIEI